MAELKIHNIENELEEEYEYDIEEFEDDFDENEDHASLLWFSATLIDYIAHSTHNKCSDIVRVIGNDFQWTVYKSADFYLTFSGLAGAANTLIKSYGICNGTAPSDENRSYYAVGRSYTNMVLESGCEPSTYWRKLYDYLLEDRVPTGG